MTVTISRMREVVGHVELVQENEGGVDWRDWGGDVGEGVEGSAGNGGGVSQWSKGVDRRTHVSQV